MLSKVKIVICVVVLVILGGLVTPSIIDGLDSASNDMADNGSKNFSILADDVLAPLVIILLFIFVGVLIWSVIKL